MAGDIVESCVSEIEEQQGEQNEAAVDVVKALYEAVAGRDDTGGKINNNVAKIIANDLEWWFHGPQNCQYMMRVLTGENSLHKEKSFKFQPRSITAIDGGCRVIAEGWEGVQAYWVHVWTISKKDGLITQFREYFNTWLTVTEFKPPPLVKVAGCGFGTRPATATLWESQPRELAKRSLPGLMLAI